MCIFQLKHWKHLFHRNENDKEISEIFHISYIKYVVFPSNLNSFLPSQLCEVEICWSERTQSITQLNSGFISLLDLLLVILESVWLLLLFQI